MEKASKGPQVIVSRAAPELVTHLFQTEVPEIYDNTVVIRAIAREAGERTKIAVMSKDKDVDAVGACVGMKGMRVQSIIRELRGEKIDIIEYHEDAVTFAEKALQPAKVSRVSIVDAGEKHLEVIVDDTQLSLAIGKKGQNVRLAAKLLGWKIDIKSEEEKRQEVEQQMTALVRRPRRWRALADWRRHSGEVGEAGITTVEGLADMNPEQLEAIPGIGPKTVEKISVAVNNYFSSLDAAEVAPDEVAAVEGRGHRRGCAERKSPATEEALPASRAGENRSGRRGWPEATRIRCRRKQAGRRRRRERSRTRFRPQSGDIEGLSDEAEASRKAWKSWSKRGSTSKPKLSKASRMLWTPMWPR